MRSVARNHPGYEPTDPPPPEQATDPPASRMAKATAPGTLGRTLILAAALATAVSGAATAIGAATVNVIEAVASANARKSNAEIDRRLEAIEARVNGRFGLDLEEKARREKDDEIIGAIEKLREDLTEVDARKAKRGR